MDVVDKKTRSRMMSGIKAKDTNPELLIRGLLHRQGFRYKLHDKSLPGSPDIVLPKYKAIVQVQGCFWHKHDCHLFKWPSTRTEFWKVKLSGNRNRDENNAQKLQDLGWKTLIVWECAIKGSEKLSLNELRQTLRYWLVNDNLCAEISGIHKD